MSPVGCTAKFYETAYGKEVYFKFKGDRPCGHSCGQHTSKPVTTVGLCCVIKFTRKEVGVLGN